MNQDAPAPPVELQPARYIEQPAHEGRETPRLRLVARRQAEVSLHATDMTVPDEIPEKGAEVLVPALRNGDLASDVRLNPRRLILGRVVELKRIRHRIAIADAATPSVVTDGPIRHLRPLRHLGQCDPPPRLPFETDLVFRPETLAAGDGHLVSEREGVEAAPGLPVGNEDAMIVRAFHHQPAPRPHPDGRVIRDDVAVVDATRRSAIRDGCVAAIHDRLHSDEGTVRGKQWINRPARAALREEHRAY